MIPGLTTVAALILLISPIHEAGALQQATPKVYGIGVESCADWLASPGREGGMQARLEAATKRLGVIAWLTGYATGAAAVLSNYRVQLRNTTGTDIQTWVTKYCGTNQTATIEVAGAALVRELSPPRAQRQ